MKPATLKGGQNCHGGIPIQTTTTTLAIMILKIYSLGRLIQFAFLLVKRGGGSPLQPEKLLL